MTPIDKDVLAGQFTRLKGVIRSTWGRLTDDEVERVAGKREELEGLLQLRYGLAKEEARRQVEELARHA